MSDTGIFFKTTDFSVGYDGKSVVSDINIELKRGEILCLVGSNGAGKTTIIKSLINQLEPIAGVAYLGKEIMAKMNENDLAKTLSVVLTSRIKTEMMTVQDIVESGRYPYTGRFGVLGEDDKKVVLNAMKLIGVTGLAERDFMKISDGQKQRVMLARAIAQEPEIIVLDEPTSFLDIKYKLEFLSTIYKLSRNNNLTVIMSLHEVDLAKKISDKVACFKDGRLDKFGNPDEVMTDDYIKKLFNINTDEIVPKLL